MKQGLKSQVAITMMESSSLVEAMVRGYHIYKDIFQNFRPGSFFHGFYVHSCQSICEKCENLHPVKISHYTVVLCREITCLKQLPWSFKKAQVLLNEFLFLCPSTMYSIPKSRRCLRLDATSCCPNEWRSPCTSSIVVCSLPKSNPICCKLSVTSSCSMSVKARSSLLLRWCPIRDSSIPEEWWEGVCSL